MTDYLVLFKQVATVIFLQFFVVGGHNLQVSDSNEPPDISIQAITISDYSDSKIHLQFPAPDPAVENPDQSSLDTWSVVWYIASFGGLILFFLIVSCSEWCCRRNARRNCQRGGNAQSVSPAVLDTPPPSYDHFAPPKYDELFVGSSRGEKSEYDVYVVPVHALGTIMKDPQRNDAPPSYQSASRGYAHPSHQPPRLHLPQAASTIT